MEMTRVSESGLTGQAGLTLSILLPIFTEKKLYCIYVAIGQKRSTVAQIVKRLTDSGMWWALIGIHLSNMEMFIVCRCHEVQCDSECYSI